MEQRALRYVARKRNGDDGKEIRTDLLHDRLLHVGGQLGARGIDLGAHVGERAVLVERHIEFHDDDSGALIGPRRHLLQPLDRTEIVFHRLDEKPFAVLGTDSRIVHLDDNVRNRNVGIGFLRNLDEGDDPGDDGDRQRRNDEARVLDRPADDPGHARAPVTFTRAPSLTNSWPTVITVAPSGTPVTHMPSGPSDTICTCRNRTIPS